MKRLMNIAAVGFAACTAFGDAEFDKLVSLAKTPTSNIQTVEQAKDVLKACCAVTNNTAALDVTKLNLVPADEVKDILRSTKTLWMTSMEFASDTCDVEFAKEAIDIALKFYKSIDKSTDNSSARRAFIRHTIVWSIMNRVYDTDPDKRNSKTNPNYKYERFSYVEDKYLTQKAQECLDSGCPELAVMFALQLDGCSLFGSPVRREWAASKKAELKEFAKNANANDETDVNEYFTVLTYFFDAGNDPASANEIFRADMFASPYVSGWCISNIYNCNSEFMQKAFDAYMSSSVGTHPDKDIVYFVSIVVKKFGNKTATERIFSKIVSEQYKFSAAFYLDDADKLIDLLMVVSDKLDAKMISQAVTVINGVDVDYRVEDVKKALRTINKKYTVKLYDDRDAWEPILSKVRAMLEVL